ncbi:hypothetical protein ABT112_01090 [Streptomyces sp. NPDC002055]|uniref:hypothetical protein n=1 Tax=Streptomyces sp. NPDC002055 TaxID=3154534 RepID=UPI00331BF0B4
MTVSRDLDTSVRREAGLMNDGKPMESVLRDLRAEGFGMIDCIKAVTRLQSCSLGEAKRTVHLSAAWADRREAHDAFHDELERQAKEELN